MGPDISDNILLELKALSVYYNDLCALDALNIDVNKGELIGVIGPNGAGKTSLVKALCGNLAYDGSVKINGITLSKNMDRRRYVGLVPQEIGLYPHLTALENLILIGRLLGLSRKKSAVAAQTALDAVNMQDHHHKVLTSLSGGMKRRINVAAAIMNNPAVIIFDEPTAGVDQASRDNLHQLARLLAQRGHAVLLITHELEQAEILCDRLLILNHGQMIAFDRPANILQQYFQDLREVEIRFSSPPNAAIRVAISPYSFKVTNSPLIWSAQTKASELAFMANFTNVINDHNLELRKITFQKAGLEKLLDHLQNGHLQSGANTALTHSPISANKQAGHHKADSHD